MMSTNAVKMAQRNEDREDADVRQLVHTTMESTDKKLAAKLAKKKAAKEHSDKAKFELMELKSLKKDVIHLAKKDFELKAHGEQQASKIKTNALSMSQSTL